MLAAVIPYSWELAGDLHRQAKGTGICSPTSQALPRTEGFPWRRPQKWLTSLHYWIGFLEKDVFEFELHQCKELTDSTLRRFSAFSSQNSGYGCVAPILYIGGSCKRLYIFFLTKEDWDSAVVWAVLPIYCFTEYSLSVCALIHVLMLWTSGGGQSAAWTLKGFPES